MKPTLIELKINTALEKKKLKVRELEKSVLQAVEIYELSLKGLG